MSKVAYDDKTLYVEVTKSRSMTDKKYFQNHEAMQKPKITTLMF